MSDTTDVVRSAEARDALLHQLAHLIDELEAIKPQLDLIPPEVLTGRPVESDPSFVEIYGLIASLDEAIISQAIRQIEDDDAVVFTSSAEELLEETLWNEKDTVAVLEEVRSKRSDLIAGLEQLSVEQWLLPVTIDGERTDLFGLAYHIIQHDAALLRAAAFRLHESRLGEQRRPAGPPGRNNTRSS